MWSRFVFLLAAVLLCPIPVAQAAVTYVNARGEWNSSRNKSLQGIIDGRGNQTGSKYVTVNLDADQVDDYSDKGWQGGGSYSLSIVAEIGGYARKNSFGIYDVADPNQKLQLFTGKSGAGAQVMFDSPYSAFGFYLKTPKGYWYSDSALNNPARGAANQDHMVAYAGKGGSLELGDNPKHVSGSVEWDSDCYLLAWEDLNLRKSDRDYNDFIVMFSDDKPNPVPDGGNTVMLVLLMITGVTVLRGYLLLRPNPLLARKSA